MRIAIYPLCAALFLACSAFSSSGDDTTTQPQDSGIPPKETTDTGSSTPPTPDAASEAAAPKCANPVTIQAVTEADVGLTECNGANAYGSDIFMNVSQGIGPGIIRFKFDGDATTAFLTRMKADSTAFISASLSLTALPECGSQCGSGIPTKAGELDVHAMRSDWDEGTNNASMAPDVCRRIFGTSPIGWGSTGGKPSAGTHIAEGVDYDVHTSSAKLADNDLSVTLPIPLADLDSRGTLGPDGTVSFFLEMNGPAGLMIIGTHESGSAAPKLTISYCP
jgi:hypothetical protein